VETNNVLNLDLDVDNRQVKPRPCARSLARRLAFQRAEEEHADQDPIVRAASGASTAELLRLDLVELAKEAAALKFERINAPPGSREQARLITRRVRALRACARTAIQIHRVEAGLPSPKVIRRITALLCLDIESAALEVLPAEQALAMIGRFRLRVQQGLDQVLGEQLGTP